LIVSVLLLEMALQDVANRGRGSGYTASVALDSKFAPIVKKGVRLDQQVSRLEFPVLRASGATNMDLWLDGNLYPTDPLTRKPPQFGTLKSCLEFLCHGESGLLGYTKRLVSTNDAIVGLEQELEKARTDCIREKVGLQNSVANLKSELDAANSRWAMRSADLLAGSTEEINMLKSESESLRSRCVALEDQLERNEYNYRNNLLQLRQQGQEAADQHAEEISLAMLQATHGLRQVREAHQQQLADGQHELTEARRALLKLRKKIERMISTPLGAQLRASKGLSELAKTGGAARARIAKIRSLLQPRVVQSIHDGNKTSKGRKRLCGNRDIQEGTGHALAQIMSQGETVALVSNPRNSFAATRMTNYYLERIGKELGTEAVLAACDMTGVSQKGYGEIYKTVKGRVQLVDKRLKATFLPNPHKVCGNTCWEH
jgi:predicted  nucleic acid-binding Zn-ribbon protein